MKISNEREGFRARLVEALQNAHCTHDSATELSRDFNARFTGRPITVHAARKWLVGESIPTQDKMRSLAQWLDVSVEWLRFGTGGGAGELSRDNGGLSRPDVKLLADLHRLDDAGQKMVREIVRMLVQSRQ